MMDRGLFLDLDGTLADSLGMLRGVYETFLNRLGKTGSDYEFDLINGPPLKESIPLLAQRHRLDIPHSDLLNQFKNLVSESYLKTKPSEGAEEVLAVAQKHGWQLGVVTSNSELLAKDWLEKNQLTGMFGAIIGAESVKNGKPHPEPYQVALTRLQCRAEKSIGVEDSVAGVESVTCAKLKAVAYVPANSRQTGFSSEAQIVRKLSELKKWLTHA
jgi:HAD superfamily hydrolase (TIGR01509 family)